jgi:hypothetical protein
MERLLSLNRMMKRTIAVGTCAAFLLAAGSRAQMQSAPAQSPAGQSSDAPRPDTPRPMAQNRATDAYAIYSMLLPGEPFSTMSADQAQHWGIADTTVNFEDINPAIPPDIELKPPQGNEKPFLEAVHDFMSRRYERITLTRAFHVDHDYKLLTPADLGELRDALAGPDPGSAIKDKWAGFPGITYFSAVYFNPSQTAALVYMSNFCTNLCANGQWVYLEKQDKQWVRRSGLNL